MRVKGGDREAGKMEVRKWLCGYVSLTKDVFKTSHFSSQFDGYKKTMISTSTPARPPDHSLKNGAMKEPGSLALPRKASEQQQILFLWPSTGPFWAPQGSQVVWTPTLWFSGNHASF